MERLAALWLALLLAAVVSLAAPPTGPALAAPSAASRQAFGVALAGRVVPGFGATQRLARVGAAWYYDYTPILDDEPPGYRKVAMVRGGEANRVDPALAAAQASRHPGHAWLIFNEPDLPGQDAVSDAFLAARQQSRFSYYAHLVHQYATAIKSADPTATLVGPNLFDYQGAGLQWLQALRAAYLADFGQELPFDVLGVHLYPFDETWQTLPQTDLRRAERFLAQMVDYAGQLPRRPRIWVTEAGALWIYRDLACQGQGTARQCRGSQVDWPHLANYTAQLVRMVSAAGVERWFYFSANPAPDPWASVPNATYLADEENQLTPMGQAWLNASPAPLEQNWASRILASSGTSS